MTRAIPTSIRLRKFAVALLLAAAPAAAPRAQEIIPFSEIHAGMKGTGRSVFSGTRVEEFQVEVIGTLENIGPSRNLILARLAGGPLAHTGVIQGMSGSPVYFGGRLAGAVAYTWGFAKEPIAGITPIQEMLAIEDQERVQSPGRPRASAPVAPGRPGLGLLRDPARLAAHFASYFAPFATPATAGTTALAPIATPLLLSGFSDRAVQQLAPGLDPAHLVPVQSGAAPRGTAATDTTLSAGSAVGIQMVRGDIEISAICTVTYREQDRVMACGHPLLNLGPADYLMTAAMVHGQFPSIMQSFEFASTGAEIGVFRQDRTTGVFGYLGRRPRMIPVRVELQPDRGRPRRFAFDVVDDPFLTPYLVYAALNGVLSSEEKSYGDLTLAYRKGTTIQIAGQDSITLENLFAGDMAPQYASGTIAFLVQVLLNNDDRPARIEGINLLLGYSDERRTAWVERAWVDRDHARPGDSLQVSALIKPFRGPAVTRQMTLEIPHEVPPGRLLLQVGDGIALARIEEESEEFRPRDLEHLIWLINHLRSFDRLYAVLTRGDNGIIFRGERLPNLPPSVARIMVRPDTRGNEQRLLFRGVAEESLQTGYALSGFKQLIIEVED